ncbi:uncharacterized protein CDAR_439961 [Caerostris darwini]|uniref:Uncharacterized protein n=1 Tax=Caerostris darwini TaxID=1538125 RepID=A0AAV4SF81_9ARAC|nr:uncharacterized protein CDAR_439961 [Caerostris darwini]
MAEPEIALTCQNVSDFEAFDHILSNGSVFEVNTTFDVTLSGNTVLPKGFLNGLVVTQLIVDDFQTQVEEGAFEGVLYIERFIVQISSMKEIPDFRAIRSSLKILQLDNSNLTQLRGDNLKNLTQLQRLSFVNNSVVEVAADVFQGTENVTHFDISHNLLTCLPTSLFWSWKSLEEVRLTHNQLLHVDQLFLGTNPGSIYLNNNNISDLSGVLHDTMLELRTLKLSYNPIEKVDRKSFGDKANNTRYLYLDHCLIREFDAQVYNELPNLETLDLSFNLIDKVANRNITEARNRPTSINLGHNLLFSLGPALSYSHVKHFSMNHNLIAHLGPGDILSVPELQELYLQGNVISRMERLTFVNVRKTLRFLNLSHNRIKVLGGCLQNFTVLYALNLSHNRIEVFAPGEFYNIRMLTVLFLEGNQITTLGIEVYALVNLLDLRISNNRIRTLHPSQIPFKLKDLQIAGNPIQCDCQMLPFLQFLNLTKQLSLDEDICSPSHNGTAPASPPDRCPASCTCSCINDSFMSVDCSSSGLTHLPPLFTEKENSNVLEVILPRANKETPFVIQPDIEFLNLSNNKIQSLEEARFPVRTKFLFLDHNLIRKPPVFLLESLEGLTLSDNPWACDCAALDFKKWLLMKSDFVSNKTLEHNIDQVG